MKFEKLRIIQAGKTTNSDVWEGKGNEMFPLVITDEAVKSVVTLGNQKPVHCRRTHAGMDMLDGYLGKFTNFVYEDGVAYADFEMSEALESAYPNEATFIATMITKEPEMLGVSVMGADERVLNDTVIDVIRFAEIYSCDIVGLPAATSSLYNNNNNQNKKTMSKFFSAFAAMLKKSSFATEVVETVDGSKITIEAAGEAMAIGDKVFDAEGNVHPDGEVRIKVDEAILVLVIENGVIAEVKPSEDPKDEQEDEIRDEKEVGRETRSGDVPEEFAKRIEALEESMSTLSQSMATLASKFNKVTGKPAVPATQMPKGKGSIKLSKEAVAEAAKRYYK